jgi:phosphate starvation-inducible PhoH-like protein
MAALALSKRQVNRIILTRPAVEAGERLGLPGDMMAKVDPTAPLFDALHDMLEPERWPSTSSAGDRDRPAGLMRGRTLNDSFIILDEARTRARSR